MCFADKGGRLLKLCYERSSRHFASPQDVSPCQRPAKISPPHPTSSRHWFWIDVLIVCPLLPYAPPGKVACAGRATKRRRRKHCTTLRTCPDSFAAALALAAAGLASSGGSNSIGWAEAFPDGGGDQVAARISQGVGFLLRRRAARADRPSDRQTDRKANAPWRVAL